MPTSPTGTLIKKIIRQPVRLYRSHPGAARATLGMIPTMDGGLRVADAMMAIAVAGGVAPQAAAWFCDLASLYVGAVGYEESIWISRENLAAAGEEPDHEALDEQLRRRLESVADRVPLRRGDDRR